MIEFRIRSKYRHWDGLMVNPIPQVAVTPNYGRPSVNTPLTTKLYAFSLYLNILDYFLLSDDIYQNG